MEKSYYILVMFHKLQAVDNTLLMKILVSKKITEDITGNCNH
jgi:hypothetical protein